LLNGVLIGRFAGQLFRNSGGMNRTSATIIVLVAALTFAEGAEAQSLRGSPASVNRIHAQAVAHRLRVHPGATSIRTAVSDGELVRLEPNANFSLVDVSYPYVVRETHTFVLRLAQQYRAACGERLVVTSATRPRSMQLANSVDKSVHPTGMAVDLRKPSNSRCLNWLRGTLVALKTAGVLDAVEERNPPHFHVAVFPSQYGSYVQRMGGTVRVASNTTSRPASSSTLASTISLPAAAPAAASKSYRVRSGDSLWTIARRNNITVASLQAANSLRGSKIMAGQVLIIPSTS
jgi:nucleoid-associated protein YgaU